MARDECITMGRRPRHRPMVWALGLALTFGSVPLGFAASITPGATTIDYQSEQGIGARRAAAIVQSRFDGTVLSVSSGSQDGKPIYRVKVLLSGGRVKVVRISASDGKVLR